ncbi:MAG: hypothetical protein MK207_08840 [Saprospiraceae bacterium]|nr:hypothetical protein [Saprospiraceae bacterium]
MDQFKGNSSRKEVYSISIRDLLSIAKDYLMEVIKYSWLIVIVALLFGKYMHYRKSSTPTLYTADFSFKFNEIINEKHHSISSLFDQGTQLNYSNDYLSDLKELQQIIVTRKIFLKVLFHRTILKNDNPGVSDFIVNHYLRTFYYTNPTDQDFYFKTDSVDPYDRKSNYLLKYIHNSIVKNQLIIDPLGSMMTIKVESTSEDFSYELVTALFNELSIYYKDKTTEQKRRFFDMAEQQTKKLRDKLSKAEAKYIEYVNTNSAEADGRNNTLIETQYLSTELKKATESYFFALSSRDAAYIAYESQKQTPPFSVIDPPLFPLAVVVPNPFLHMIFGFILGGLLVLIIVVGRKFLRDYIQYEIKEQEYLDSQEIQELV